MAARTALIEYDTTNVDSAILTVEEAVEKSSYIQVPPPFQPEQIGDFSKGMAEADQKILSAEVLLFSLLFISVFCCSDSPKSLWYP